MNDEQREVWGHFRRKGAVWFILMSTLFMGGFFAAVISVVNYLRRYGLKLAGVRDYLTDGWFYFWLLFSWLFFGLGWGIFYWFRNERRFKRY